jgi:hypothetical protein
MDKTIISTNEDWCDKCKEWVFPKIEFDSFGDESDNGQLILVGIIGKCQKCKTILITGENDIALEYYGRFDKKWRMNKSRHG